MTRARVLPSLDVLGYVPHALHSGACEWVEKNCYVDVCIELLHTLGMEPLAAMSSAVAIDFEDDNFTFFKPSHDELRTLYGIDVQELNVWRPLLDHAREHLATGRFIATEIDSFWLPDTAGTDYRRNHVKTTIILADVDLSACRLGYFHNTGYHQLQGEDFNQLFQLGALPEPAALPLFAEVIKIARRVHRSPDELAGLARGFLLKHLERRAAGNPVQRFQERTQRDLPTLHDRGLPYFHAWAFATVRQFGASCELLAAHLRWLLATSTSPESHDARLVAENKRLGLAAHEFDAVSRSAKSLILKVARAVNGRRALQAQEVFDEMSTRWTNGMAALVELAPTMVSSV
ncbi:MAG: DUF1839 family protein [Gemmatimonadota bacterium]